METSWVYTLLSLFLLIILFKYSSKHRRTKLPPSPWPSLPLLGHLHLLKFPFHRTYHSLSLKLGPIFSLRYGNRLMVVVSSPAIVEECFTRNDIVLANRPRFISGKLIGYNYSTLAAASYGDYWRNLRRLTTVEIFSSSRLNSFQFIRHDEIRLMLTKLCAKSRDEFARVELRPFLSELNFNNIMRMVAGKRYFGVDEDDDVAKEFRQLIAEAVTYGGVSNPGDFFPVFRWIDYRGLRKKMSRLFGRMDGFLQGLIDEHRVKKDGNSMIHHLLSLQESEPHYYTDVVIKATILLLSLSMDATQQEATHLETPAPLIFPQSQLISMKLDESNYLIWRQQVFSAIRGYGLLGYINGKNPMPQEYITNENTLEQTLNPAYEHWARQDQLLASWVLSSISNSLLVLMVGLDSSKEIWDAIESNFASESIAKQMHYKLQLQTLKKGNMGMREYLSKIKGYCDVLASVGQKVSDQDHILYIISGLGNEYDAVMVTISSHFPPYTVMEVRHLLLSFESRLDSLSPQSLDMEGSQPSLLLATQNSSRFSNSPSQTNFRGRGNSIMRGRGRYGARGNYRGRGGRYTTSRPVCQLCHGAGHTVEKCWYRFDSSYNGPPQHTTHNQQSFGRNPTLNMVHAPSYGAHSDVESNLSWYPDSGASHHVSNELSNLSIASEYTGNSRLQMGNGAGPSNTGHSSPRDS